MEAATQRDYHCLYRVRREGGLYPPKHRMRHLDVRAALSRQWEESHTRRI
jgi:hypothetical protein